MRAALVLLIAVGTALRAFRLGWGLPTYVFPDAHWEVALTGKNLTDAFYFTSGGADMSVGGTSSGVLAPPRTVTATVRWRY